MKLDDLIEKASSNHPIDLAEMETVAHDLNLPVPDVLDLFARTVATCYLHGDYTYEVADMAMNQLFGFAYDTTDLGLSDLAWEIFIAFDEGEYLHPGGASVLQGEALTRELLNNIRSSRGQHGS